MSEQTKIEWCDATFNPWIGCTKVGPGCDHCYAERDWDLRRHRVAWGAGQARSRTSVANWREPVRWNMRPFVQCVLCGLRCEAAAADVGNSCPRPSCPGNVVPARRRVFCASLADVFDNEVPREWRYDLLWLISNTPNLDWLLLTKRVGTAERMLTDECARMGFPWSAKRWRNVWLGATVVNQAEADRDVPKLLATQAAVRFLSMEPMLGPITLRKSWRTELQSEAFRQGFNVRLEHASPAISWVIAGGESGPKARPAHPDWFRELRDQCAAAGVPFLFKQWGEWAPGQPLIGSPGQTLYSGGGMKHHVMHDGFPMARIGKKSAGRLLDGVEHNGFPVPA